jgi:DNA-binding NarL/FixJ family response regulator
MFLGRSALGRGDLARAGTSLTEAAVLLAENDPGRMLVWCLSSLCQVHAMRGAAAEAAQALVRAEAADVPVIRCYRVELELARAWTAAAAGARERARAGALSTAEQAFDEGAWGAGALALHDAARLGARTTALWSRAAPHLQGPLFETMALAARAGADPTRVIATAKRFEALGANLWAAELYAAAARRHARRGETELMHRARERCLALAAQCGGAATPALVDVDELGLSAELSEREREVARLAAQGLTNKAIAAELSLSVRTVENHLARALRRLGLKNRRALVGFFGT